MIVVVGSGLVAVTAAQRLLDVGHDVTLTTAHAEFGFPHGGCGLWTTDVLPWPLDTLEEAVATSTNGLVTCRSQWLVKRLVHRFAADGGQTSTRVRFKDEGGTTVTVGTGAVLSPPYDRIFVADQDVPEPAPSIGEPLLNPSSMSTWYGAIVVEGTPMSLGNHGVRSDGSIEVWTQEKEELAPFHSTALETMQVTWVNDGEALDAARVASRVRDAVDAFLTSGLLDEA